MQKIYTASVNLTDNTYKNCQTITQVDLMQTPWVNNSMEHAFNNCSNLHTVTNINSKVIKFNGVFNNCRKLVNAPTLPPTVRHLSQTFRNCTNLVNAPEIPLNTLLMTMTFMDCSNIISAPTIPNSVISLSGTFSGCTRLTTVPSLENTRDSVPSSTFKYCSNLIDQPILPKIAYDLTQTFFGCSKLASINLPQNIIYLPETYYGCSNLTSVPNISINVSNMYHTFGACVNITGDINILSDKITNVTNIFGETSARKNVYIPPVCYNDTSINSPTYNAFIAAGYDNIGTKDGVYLMYNYSPALPSDWITSTTANGTTVLEQYIGTNTTVVTPHNDWYSNKVLNEASYSDGPFQNNKNITSVDLANVEVINNSLYKCFDSCSNLQSVTNINQNVTNLVAAFQLCESLTTPPILPSTTTNMGGTFAYCYNLQSPPTIPQNVTYMDSTFRYCYQFTEIPAIPQSVTSLSYAFINCNNITTANVNVPNCINISNTFAGCSNLTDVNIIAPSATDITDVFNNCTNLTNVHAEFNSVNDIVRLFADKQQLERVNITAPNATNASRIFNNCNCLTTVNWNIASNADITWAFTGCSNLVTVPDLPTNTTDLYRTFHGCRSLTELPTIPNSVTCLEYAFVDCKSITNSPVIPNGVINMGASFLYCESLTTAPAIPNSVILLTSAFMGTNIADMPAIPNSVISMSDCFHDCPRLVNVTNIPNSVQYLSQTFYNCQNLTGNIYIHSNQISTASSCFYSTSLIKNVFIPFEYENGVATQTYNSFIAAGYGTDEYLHGVHLKDIDGSKVTINPTPADAAVLMYNENTGKEIDETVLNKFSYIKTGDDVEIQGLNTTDTAIVVPSIWTETKSMRAIEGSVIHYRVLKDGYYPVEGQITVDGSQTINVNLEQILCTFTVVPFPSDATVTLTTNISEALYAWYSSEMSYRGYSKTETVEIGTKLYYITGSVMGEVINVGSSRIDVSMQGGTIEAFTRDSSWDTTTGPVQAGNSITVPWGTEVSYTVSKEHYQTVTGTEIVKTTGNKYIPLAIDQHTFTINPTPADAAVQILINGKLVNASSTDWIFTANNANGDIELQEYIGSNTVVVMPTSYETTNTVTADYGSTIEWTVSKEHYRPQTDTLILTSDTVIEVELDETIRILDVTDYTHTNDSGIVTLTQYIGNGGDIDTPEITEI